MPPPPGKRKKTTTTNSRDESSSTASGCSSETQEDTETGTDEGGSPSARQAALARVKEIAEKIRSGELEPVYMNVFRPNMKVLTPLWQRYKPIRDVVTHVPVNAVQCGSCGLVLTYHVDNTGSNSLTRHTKTCQGPSNVILADLTIKKDPPKSAKDDFKLACTKFCAMGLRPPECLSDEGLILLVQTAVDLGAQNACYGRLDARKLVPCPNTVSKMVSEEAKKAKQENAKDAAAAIKERRCAATCDAYTDDTRKEKYLAFVLHFIEQWKMQDRLLFIAPLGDESATAETQLRVIEGCFEELGIPKHLIKRIKFTTDAGADIKKALEEHDWHYCVAHGLNIVLRTAMSIKYATIVQNMLHACPEAFKLIEKANKWVRDVRLGIPAKDDLLAKLKCSNWQSGGHVPTLLGVIIYRPKVRQVIGAQRAEAALAEIGDSDIDAMTDLCDFLRPFDLHESKRESSSTVTTSRYPALAKHLLTKESDSPMIETLKAAGRREFVAMPLLILIAECKELVTYLKRSTIVTQLEHTVKQEVATRWNSHHIMLSSVLHEWPQIFNILSESKQGRAKIRSIDVEELQAVVNFLEPFMTHTDKLQGQLYPTLPYATLALHRLIEHCQPQLDDSPALAAIRSKALSLLREKILITMDHKIASFLWPSIKALKMYRDPVEKSEVHEAVRARIRELQGGPIDAGADEDNPPAQEEQPTPTAPPPATKSQGQGRHSDFDLYGSLMSQDEDQDLDEVDRYIRMSPGDIGDDSDILNWWKTQGEARYPGLARVAKQVFALPATSGSSERVFNHLGDLLDDKRSNVAPIKASDTLILRDHLRRTCSTQP